MRYLAWFAFPFGAGAALLIWGLPVIAALVLAGGALAAAAVLLAVRKGWSRAAVAVLGLAAGLLWTSGYYALRIAPLQQYDGAERELTVTLTDYPQPGEYGMVAQGKAQLDGRRVRLRLYAGDELAACRPGDCLTLTVQLETGADNPSVLRYRRSTGIQLTALQRTTPVIEPAERLPLWAWPRAACQRLKQSIAACFPADAAGLVQALLTGDRSGLSYAQTNLLSLSGVSHAVAISGMHVSILLGLVLLLTGRRHWLAAAVGIPVVVFFALLVGAPASVVRAAVMQILVLLAPLLRREPDSPTTLGTTFLLMLLQNPWALAGAGFQMSFGSVAGILLFSGRLSAGLCRRLRLEGPRKRLPGRLGRMLIQSVSVSLSALVFTTPVAAFVFGSVSLLAPVTNVLTLWAITLVFQLSLPVCLLGLLWLAPARLLGWVIAWLVRYIWAVVGSIGNLPLSAVYADSDYIAIWLWFCYLAFGLFLLWGGRKRIVPLACSLVLGLCLALLLQAAEADRGTLCFQVLDVGQGQCLLLDSGGASAVIDCGGSDADEAGELAARTLLQQGKNRLDILVLTHYDRDHAGGVPQLLSRIAVSAVYLPQVEDAGGLRGEIEQAAAATGAEIYYVTENRRITMASARLQIFAPVAYSSDNDASLSVLYTLGDYDILITGDMSQRAERILLDVDPIPDIEVLVAGHHGAASSTSQLLLDETRPETVLISVGRNSYGHPSEATLSRIAQAGAEVYRTDQCGTITIRR